MNNRLEVGCEVLVVAIAGEPRPLKTALVGCRAKLSEGPYYSSNERSNCWTLVGLEVQVANLQAGRRHGHVRGVPSSILVRIDDPSVTFDSTHDELEKTQ